MARLVSALLRRLICWKSALLHRSGFFLGLNPSKNQVSAGCVISVSRSVASPKSSSRVRLSALN